MKIRTRRRCPWRAILLASLASFLPALALGLDTTPAGPYATVLREHTKATDDLAGTRVDYGALVRNPLWQRVIADLEKTPLDSLRTREENLAFWINAYNIYAIDWMVRNHPVQSIRDIGNFFRPVWKRTVGRIGGSDRSLDEIEHAILRPLGEPRVHGAIVCASLSCPPLRRTPFEAASLGAQLDEQMRVWLENPRKGAAFDRTARRLGLSRIFDWFAADFVAAGGTLRFIGPYLAPDDRAWLASHPDDVTIYFLPYDWASNGVATTGKEN